MPSCSDLTDLEHQLFAAMCRTGISKQGYFRCTRGSLGEKTGLPPHEFQGCLEALLELGLVVDDGRGCFQPGAGVCNCRERVVEIAQSFANNSISSGASAARNGLRPLRRGEMQPEADPAAAAPPRGRARYVSPLGRRKELETPTTSSSTEKVSTGDSSLVLAESKYYLRRRAREAQAANPQRPQKLRRKDPKKWTGLDLAQYFDELVRDHLVADGQSLGAPTNLYALAKHFNTWRKEGLEPTALKAMVELYVRIQDDSRQDMTYPHWKNFVYRREYLFKQVQKQKKAAVAAQAGRDFWGWRKK